MEKLLKKKRLRGRAFIKKLENNPEIFSESPESSLFVIHNTDADIYNYKVLRSALEYHGQIQFLIIIPGIKYAYVSYQQLESAVSAHSDLNSPDNILNFQPKPHALFLYYTHVQIDQLILGREGWCMNTVPVAGLSVDVDYIDEDYERLIVSELESFDWEILTNRRVLHFGFNFQYGSNDVNPNNHGNPVPQWMLPLLEKLRNDFNIDFDQITVNDYAPGNSIPSHIDSHSPFEELLASLSLLSDVSMNFRKDPEEFNLLLPARSLLCLTGESRYAWRHAILQRKYDIIGGMVQYRNRRVSLTFRKLRFSPCECKFKEYCDHP